MKSVRCILTYFHFANEQVIDHKSSLEPRTLAWYYWPCYPNCIIPAVWNARFPQQPKEENQHFEAELDVMHVHCLLPTKQAYGRNIRLFSRDPRFSPVQPLHKTNTQSIPS